MTDRRRFPQGAAGAAVPAMPGASSLVMAAQAAAAVPVGPPRMPPGVSPTDFNRVLSAWRDTVGGEWVFTSADDVALYRDAYSPAA